MGIAHGARGTGMLHIGAVMRLMSVTISAPVLLAPAFGPLVRGFQLIPLAVPALMSW